MIYQNDDHQRLPDFFLLLRYLVNIGIKNTGTGQ